MNDVEEERYHVKGYWSIEGIFNGAIYRNNRKFGTVIRVKLEKINVQKSIGKDLQFRRFKRWLSENKLRRHDFLTEEIGIYMEEHPEKKLKLI